MPCNLLYCLCGNYYAPQRHVMAVICMFYLILMYAHRVCLNLAIVEMVIVVKKNQTSEVCPLAKNESSVILNIKGGTRKWSETDQAISLQMFFLGYIVMHIPAGYLCDRFGAKLWMLVGLGISSISTAMIPPTVIFFDHWIPIAILRFFTGCGQAVLFPGMSCLMGRWIPLKERGTIGGFLLSSSSLGVVAGNLGTGFLIKLTGSWIICFEVWGILGLILAVFFGLYIYSYPEIHKHISDQEMTYLQESIGKKERGKTPYKEILGDIRIWSMMFAQLGYDYLHFTVLTNLPKYMNNVLNYNITQNAVATSIPQVCMFLSALAIGRLGDCLITKGCKIVHVRIGCTITAMVFPALFMLIGGLMDCNRVLTEVFFCFALIAKGAFYAGLKVNIIDASINHTGFIMGLVNGLGSLGGNIAPHVISSIAKNNTLPQWHLVFLIQVIVSVIPCISYVTFAKGNRAGWDYSPEEQEEHETGKKECRQIFSCYKPY